MPVDFKINADVSRFISEIESAIKHLSRFNSLSKGIKEIQDALKQAGEVGALKFDDRAKALKVSILRLSESIAKLEDKAKRNKLVHTSVASQLDILIKKYGELRARQEEYAEYTSKMTRAGKATGLRPGAMAMSVEERFPDRTMAFDKASAQQYAAARERAIKSHRAFIDQKTRLFTREEELEITRLNKLFRIRQKAVDNQVKADEKQVAQKKQALNIAFRHHQKFVDNQKRLYEKEARQQEAALIRTKRNLQEFARAWEKAKQIQADYVKQQAASTSLLSGKGTFGSPEWFAQRALWFVQLRATWAAYQGFRDLASSVISFNQSMANLKAISRASTEELKTMEGAIRTAATSTKFFAGDMADAAVKLAQAGFSAREVAEMVGPIAVLASAVNRELTETSDAVRIIIRGFGLEASQANKVVNVLAAGISNSAVQIEDFNTGLQHFITTAKQFGWKVESLVAWLGVLRNVGFKAGTAMTALRQITKVLTDETPKFSNMLKRVGLQFEDVTLKTHSFDKAMSVLSGKGVPAKDFFKAAEVDLPEEVTKNLDKGLLTAADIYASMRVRAAGVTVATMDLVEEAGKLEEKITDTNSAWEMMDDQLKGIENRLKIVHAKTQEVAISVTDGGKLLEPFVWMFEQFVNLVLAGFTTIGYIIKQVLVDLPNLILDIFATVVNTIGHIFRERFSMFISEGFVGGIKAGVKEGLEYLKDNFFSEIKKSFEEAFRKGSVGGVEGVAVNLGKKLVSPAIKSGVGASDKERLEYKAFDYKGSKIGVRLEDLSTSIKLLVDASKTGIMGGDPTPTIKSFEEVLGGIVPDLLNKPFENLSKTLSENAKIFSQTTLDAENTLRRIYGLQELKFGKDKKLSGDTQPPGGTVDKDRFKKISTEHSDSILSAIQKLRTAREKVFKDELAGIEQQSQEIQTTIRVASIGIVSPERIKELGIERLQENVNLLNKQREAYEKLTLYTPELQNAYDKIKDKLVLTNAELKEQERLASRTFGEAFKEGIQNAQDQFGTLADMAQKAGGQIHGILVDTIASGLTTMQDSLANNEHSWRDWARAALQSIRDVINQLIALYVMKQLLGFAMSSGGGGSGSTAGGHSGSPTPAQSPYGPIVRTAHSGGVLPSFKRFAGGGLTSGPAFAILGDNASGKELVIPSENISRDRVEGHVRDKDDKGDLNIVNITDPNQIYGLMGAVRGQQLIVNAISYDVGRHGPTYRTLKGVR